MWLSKLRGQSLAVRVVTLQLVMVGFSLLIAPVIWYASGRVGLISAAMAGLACLVGCGMALVVGEPFRRTRRLLHGMLFGMLFRMGVPFVVALIVNQSGRYLMDAGFIYYLVVYFEVALLVEVFLSLPPAEQRKTSTQGSDQAVSEQVQ